jgi:hypothetical protein
VVLHPVVLFFHLVEVPLYRSMGRSIPVNLVEIGANRERDASNYRAAVWHLQMFFHARPTQLLVLLTRARLNAWLPSKAWLGGKYYPRSPLNTSCDAVAS